MKPPCDRFRAGLLDSGEAALPRELGSHPESCAECARFATRLAAARAALRGHHANLEPDAGFAARVAAHARRDPADDLGHAALKLLPATLMLLAVLAWIAFRSEPQPADGSTQDVLGWLAADTTGGRP